MQIKELKSYLLLHLVVLIYGFTAVLGKMITVYAAQLVWFRTIIAFLAFLAFMLLSKKGLKVDRKTFLQLLGIGTIVGLHWTAFFGAVKLSNVSVTLGCMASTTLFTSILEPIFYKRRIDPLEVIIGLFIISGLYLIFQFETDQWMGIVVALIASFLASLFTVLNQGMAQKVDAVKVSAYEMLGGAGVVSIVLLLQGDFTLNMFHMPLSDWMWITILALVCTAFAFAASVKVMEKLSAFSVVLAINLEPIYGILLAILFFGQDEKMSFGFYIGTIVILLSVFVYPILKKKRKRQEGSKEIM